MIELSRVCKTYETGSKAVKDISLTIDDGEFVFIVGRTWEGCRDGIFPNIGED